MHTLSKQIFSKQERDEMILSQKPYVLALANRYGRSIELREDLVSVGWEATCHAMSMYDSSKSAFSSYNYRWMRSRMWEYISSFKRREATVLLDPDQDASNLIDRDSPEKVVAKTEILNNLMWIIGNMEEHLALYLNIIYFNPPEGRISDQMTPSKSNNSSHIRSFCEKEGLNYVAFLKRRPIALKVLRKFKNYL